MNKAEHKKVAEGLYKKLEVAVAALEKAEKGGNLNSEIKANDRIEALEAKIALLEKPEKPEVDETVCQECGGDLYQVEDGVFYCEVCKQYYELEEEEE